MKPARNAVAAQIETKEKKSGIVPTLEQRIVIDAFVKGKNVCVIAGAGVGKTTTLKACAKACSEKKCLLLTYNKELQRETEKSVAAESIKNLTVYTMHGAASRAYGNGAINDDKRFIDAVRGGPPERIEVLECDALFIDETQDMAIHYYLFTKHAHQNKQIVVVGDPRQMINAHTGARVEFLTRCQELFANGREWAMCTLRTSQRLTPATAEFVNTHVLGVPAGSPLALVGGNTRDVNLKPRYVVTNYGNAAAVMWRVVQEAVGKYGVENVALIAPSTRGNNPKNPLTQLKKECMTKWVVFQARDDEIVRGEDIAGKFAIVTWNSMKGRERDCVIVVNFDETYFKYFARDWESPGVPNVMYVAATRARKELIVVADGKNTLRSIDMDRLALHVQPPLGRGGSASTASAGIKKTLKPRKAEISSHIGVLDLLRHLDAITMYEMSNLVEVVARRKVGAPAKVPDLSARFESGLAPSEEKKGMLGLFSYNESVAHLYGIVVPRIAEWHMRDDTDFGRDISQPMILDAEEAKKQNRPFELNEAGRPVWYLTKESYSSFPKNFWAEAKSAAETLPSERTFVQWFQLAVAHNALHGQEYHTARQIRNYDWIDEAFVDECVRCVDKVLGDPGTSAVLGPALARDRAQESVSCLALRAGQFEVGYSKTIDSKIEHVGVKTVVGFVDFIEDETGVVWEFKCTKGIQLNHMLQLACYLAISGQTTGQLYAILSGDIVTIKVKDAPELLRLALSKYGKKQCGDIHDDIANFVKKYEVSSESSGNGDLYDSPLLVDAATLDDLY